MFSDRLKTAITRVTSALKKYSVRVSHDIGKRSGDSAMEIDDKKLATRNEPDQWQIALWPLYDVTAVRTHIAILRDLTSSPGDTNTAVLISQLQRYLTYQCGHGITQPSSVLPLALGSSDVTPGTRDAAVLQALSCLMHRQSSLHVPRRWMLWTRREENEDEAPELQQQLVSHR